MIPFFIDFTRFFDFNSFTYTQLPWKFMDALLENFSTKFSITDFKNTSLKNTFFFFLRTNMNLRTILSVLENTSNTTPRARLEPVLQISCYLKHKIRKKQSVWKPKNIFIFYFLFLKIKNKVFSLKFLKLYYKIIIQTYPLNATYITYAVV